MALKDHYLTISQTAELMRVTRQTVSRWVANGQVPTEKVGRETLIDKAALLQYRQASLAENVASQIVQIILQAYREYIVEKGYVTNGCIMEGIKAGKKHIGVKIIESGGCRTINLSAEENDEVRSHYETRVKGYLANFVTAVKDKVEESIPAECLPTEITKIWKNKEAE